MTAVSGGLSTDRPDSAGIARPAVTESPAAPCASVRRNRGLSESANRAMRPRPPMTAMTCSPLATQSQALATSAARRTIATIATPGPRRDVPLLEVRPGSPRRSRQASPSRPCARRGHASSETTQTTESVRTTAHRTPSSETGTSAPSAVCSERFGQPSRPVALTIATAWGTVAIGSTDERLVDRPPVEDEHLVCRRAEGGGRGLPIACPVSDQQAVPVLADPVSPSVRHDDRVDDRLGDADVIGSLDPAPTHGPLAHPTESAGWRTKAIATPAIASHRGQRPVEAPLDHRVGRRPKSLHRIDLLLPVRSDRGPWSMRRNRLDHGSRQPAGRRPSARFVGCRLVGEQQERSTLPSMPPAASAPPSVGDRLRLVVASEKIFEQRPSMATSSSGAARSRPSPNPHSIGRPLSLTSTWEASIRPCVMPSSCRSARVEAAPATIDGELRLRRAPRASTRDRPPCRMTSSHPSAIGALRMTDTTPGWLARRRRSPSLRSASVAASADRPLHDDGINLTCGLDADRHRHQT